MKIVCFLICLLTTELVYSQFSKDSIYSHFVLKKRRTDLIQNLYVKTIDVVFNQPFDTALEHQYEEACWAISQLLINKPIVQKGFTSLLKNYTLLQPSTKRSLLEAIYANYPFQFVQPIEQLSQKETIPKLFAMQIVYLQRAAILHAKKSKYISILQQRTNDWKNEEMIIQLKQYIQTKETKTIQPLPAVKDWFIQQKNKGIKTVYSFQRWNRNYAGLAIIQLENGQFARDKQGNLLVFEQLARSASDLPFFITNGSTPQGIFSIQGIDVSTNLFIGPTPNLQLLMPFENDSLFYKNNLSTTDYKQILPTSWQNHVPIYESFFAGKIGRTEIIAHGTTIDAELFKEKSFYPFTPTLGCLCAKEIWNNATGKLEISHQLNLVNAFLQTEEKTGMLVVININNIPKPVTKLDIEKWVIAFENNKQ